MQCPQCNATVRGRARFCEQCGTALQRCCPACGKTVGVEARFCGECGASLTNASSAAIPTTTSAAASTAERRQLTIMFCDMVGSSAMSTRLDPEEQREVVAAFQATCTEEIKRFDGMVAQYLGDGVLAYFGYPAAHEDDAERAVRAGLAILGAIPTLKTAPGVSLQARIGIATGVVVVGDLVRGGVTQENAAVGETTNLAARLQALAEPDSLVIAPDTYRLVGSLFEYHDLGTQQLKGFGAPIHVRRVLRSSTIENRFEMRRPAGAAGMLGRDEELELVLRRWEEAKAGRGRVVLITGEAGIGKSRLTRALQDALTAELHTCMLYHCSPYHQDSAFYPIIGQLTRATRIERDDTAESKLNKLEALLGSSSLSLANDMPLFAALLSIPGGERYPLPSLAPKLVKEKTLVAMLGHLKRLAGDRPVLIVFEDLHWIDATSLELVSRIVEQSSSLRLLLVATARPEFVLPWPSQRHTSTVVLTRLGRSEIEALVSGVAGGKPLPPEVLDQIVIRTDGIPLFVEELTKTVLDSGLLRDLGDRYALAGLLPPLAIPSTLHASLLARLDRLASVKDVAQIGATIGREFNYPLIAAVSGLPDHELQNALGQLVRAELIFQRGSPPDARYQFKHALVQDAAQVSLVRSRRQQLHARIAQILQERFPETEATEPEVLAHHYTEAGLPLQALPLWRLAGQRAVERSANHEAIGHLNKALGLIKDLPGSLDCSQEELDLLLLLGPVLMFVRGVSAPEVGNTYERARQLSQHIGDPAQKFAALWGAWYFHNGSGDHLTAREMAEQLLSFSRHDENTLFRIMAHRTLCNTLHHIGELAATREHMDRVIDLYDSRRHSTLAIQYGQDPSVTARAWGSLAVWLLGYPDQALLTITKARQTAIELSHAPSLAYALGWAAVLHRFRREYQEALEKAEATIALSIEHGFGLYAAWGTTVRGWALSNMGQAVEGCEQVRKGLSELRATGLKGALPHQFALLAESLAAAGRAPEGLSALDEALTLVEAMSERNYQAELHRLKGELLLQVSGWDTEGPEACFKKALEVARQQQAKSLELRAATSLADLWRHQGKHVEGRELLAPVYGWFTEGLDLLDLRTAKTLIDELGKESGASRRSKPS